MKDEVSDVWYCAVETGDGRPLDVDVCRQVEVAEGAGVLGAAWSRDEYWGGFEARWLVFFVRSGSVFAAREVIGVQGREPVVDFGGRVGWARDVEVALDVDGEWVKGVEGSW